MDKRRARRLHAVYELIGRLNGWIGRGVAWLTLLMVGLTALVVGLRYGLGQGSVALQESVTYLHCMVFMLGAAMTLERGGHVRVDIFYRDWSVPRRALVDLLGSLLLLIPLMIFTLYSCWGYVADAWAVRESSIEPGGLHAIYLLKTLILVMAVMLLLQGVADALRNALVLAGLEHGEARPSLAPEERI
ncbi:MAG: TRAP transporter small permease subunit [Gammaproteobacteria bacterium]|nr:TRAP transporter small permease subunit [Gammaproteobacteria bacterium]